jgi:hypothetical protein
VAGSAQLRCRYAGRSVDKNRARRCLVSPVDSDIFSTPHRLT